MTDSRVEALLRALENCVAALAPFAFEAGKYQFAPSRTFTPTECDMARKAYDAGRAALAEPLPEPASEPTISTGWEMARDMEMQEGPGGTTRLSQRTLSQGAPEPRYEKDLAHLATLGPNWDSYGGVPITAEAIAAVRAWIRDIQICPRSDGGLQIELAARPGAPDHDVAFEPDGTIEQRDRYWAAREALDYLRTNPAPASQGAPEPSIERLAGDLEAAHGAITADLEDGLDEMDEFDSDKDFWLRFASELLPRLGAAAVSRGPAPTKPGD